MEPYYEADKEFIDGLFLCERDFLLELVEERGLTWKDAKILLQRQNETFGKPTHVSDWVLPNGKGVSKVYDWPEVIIPYYGY